MARRKKVGIPLRPGRFILVMGEDGSWGTWAIAPDDTVPRSQLFGHSLHGKSDPQLPGLNTFIDLLERDRDEVDEYVPNPEPDE